jgi:hypothetical protein
MEAIKLDLNQFLSEMEEKEISNQIIDKIMGDKELQLEMGSSLELIKQILSGDVDNGVAIVKSNKIEENISLESLLAQYLIKNASLKRIFILNIDIQHNFATQRCFLSNNKYLVIRQLLF